MNCTSSCASQHRLPNAHQHETHPPLPDYAVPGCLCCAASCSLTQPAAFLPAERERAPQRSLSLFPYLSLFSLSTNPAPLLSTCHLRLAEWSCDCHLGGCQVARDGSCCPRRGVARPRTGMMCAAYCPATGNKMFPGSTLQSRLRWRWPVSCAL